MKTRSFVPSRALAAIVAAILASPTIAGDVTVSRVDLATGDLKPVTTGALTHAPAYFFPDSSKPLLADTCGALYEIKTDVYGEKTLQGPIDGDRSLAEVRLLAQDKYGAVGIGLDGKSRSIDPTYQYQDMVFDVSRGGDSPLDLGKTRLFVAGTGDFPHLAFFDDGRLLGAYNLKGGTPAARFIAPRNGWSNIRHAISTYIGLGRSRRIVMITIDDAGQMMIHEPVEESEGFESYVTSTQGKPLGTDKFTGTKGLFAHSGDIAYRWTEGGDLFAVDLNKGTEKQLGRAGAYRGAFMAKPDNDLYLVAATGSFAECPVEKVIEPEVPVGKPAIVIAAEELKAMEKTFYEAVRKQQKKEYPGDIWEKNAGQLATILSPRLADIERFEATLAKPVREKVAAFTAAYGDQNAANIALEPHTGSTVFLEGALNSLQNRLDEWDKYRRDMAADIASNGQLYFQLAQAVGNSPAAAEHFSKAKPYGDWALRFDPANATAKEIIALAEKNVALAKSAEAAAIASAVWPDDSGNFDFDKNDMKEKVLAHFQKHRDDGDGRKGARYFAIRLSSGWEPGLVNWLGHILEWRVSGYIASTIPGDPKHAYVTPIQIGTQTNSKTSPFENRYFSSGGYRIPIERVPADDEAALQESLKLISK